MQSDPMSATTTIDPVKPAPWKRAVRHVPAVLGLCLLIGAVTVVLHEFHALKMRDIAESLRRIPDIALFKAFLWTILSYGVLTFYDRLGTIYAGHKVSYRRVAFASFCAYALSHNLGFPAVSGAAVRYRLYAHWGLAPLEIAKVVAFCSLTFGLGGMVLGGIILFYEPGSIPFFGTMLPHWAMYCVGIALWAVVAAYVTLSKVVGTVRLFGHEAVLPGWRMAIVQVILATVDVAVTASIFYTLLPPSPSLTYLRFLGCYVASYTAGLAANLPGGIGVFDSAMLIGLADHIPAPQIVGAIVVFRLFYYVIPLFLAGSLFAGNEVLLRGGDLWRRGSKRVAGRGAHDGGGSIGAGGSGGLVRMMPASRGAAPFGRWNEPDFAIGAATGVVAMCGALLLLLGVLMPQPDFTWIDPDFGDLANHAGQYVPSLIGTGLLVLAIGLSRRVTLAWGSTIVLLLLAAAFTAAQGVYLWIPAVLVLAILLVAPFRGAFYRHARLLTGPMEWNTVVPLLALMACMSALAIFGRHYRFMSHNSWWALVLSPDLPNSQRATVFLTVLLALVAIWRLIRPSRVTYLPWTPQSRLRYATLGAMPPLRADGVIMGEAERAALPFRRLGGVLLGLGDPVGAESDRPSAIWRLRDLAAQEGMDAAVWRAGKGLLKVYSDLGLTALPLNELGLPADNGRVCDPQKYLCCVAERDLHRLLPLLPELSAPEAQAAE
jgi:phosphatidylglycerol lysyltransferase